MGASYSAPPPPHPAARGQYWHSKIQHNGEQGGGGSKSLGQGLNFMTQLLSNRAMGFHRTKGIMQHVSWRKRCFNLKETLSPSPHT